MTPEEKRSVDQAYGMRAAAATNASMEACARQLEEAAIFFRNRDAALRIAMASGGTAQDALTMVSVAGENIIEVPVPRLVAT